jgi:hypothetical protein
MTRWRRAGAAALGLTVPSLGVDAARERAVAAGLGLTVPWPDAATARRRGAAAGPGFTVLDRLRSALRSTRMLPILKSLE